MGLSASQAKLLSITARISDNELRSQTITAAKMSLANKSSAASREYMDALNSTELIYSTYDMDGNKTYVDLTGAQLSQYAPLKNQYSLVNSKNQVLVSELDAKNYEASNNLNEFLEKYGIQAIETGDSVTLENPDYKVEYDSWSDKYGDWLLRRPDPMDEKYWDIKSGTDNELYEIFTQASAKCFNSALSGSRECYLHVLAHMIDLTTDGNGNPSGYPKTITTSTGASTSINASNIWGSFIWGSNINGKNGTEAMKVVSNAISNGWDGKQLYAAKHPYDSYENPTENDKLISDYYLQQAKNNGTQSSLTEKQKLLSNYCYDSNGEIQLKTLQQKCIDMFYAVSKEIADYNTVLIPAIYTFQDDMCIAFNENTFKREDYAKDLENWKVDEPKMKDIPPTIDEPLYKYSDNEKAQWYVNLWHRMNGGESETKDGTVTNSEIHTTKDENGNYNVNKTDTTIPRYEILEDGLMNSSQWLKYAFESGTVTLERVNYTNPTETGTGLKKATWTSIIYTNALDISEQTDDAAIAKAEAKYEAETKDIEAKDKQFDSMLKLLDTEHTALQTEFDSVKTVINKNMERTLKIYSA